MTCLLQKKTYVEKKKIIFFGGGGLYSYVYLPIIRTLDTSKQNL